VIAEKDRTTAAIEAKFHNSPGTRSEVHVALYTKARFDDIKIKIILTKRGLLPIPKRPLM